MKEASYWGSLIGISGDFYGKLLGLSEGDFDGQRRH